MRNPIWWLILVVALGGAAVLYFWLTSENREPQVQQAPPVPPAEPAVRHPIEPVRPTDEAAKPLPTLAESDGAMRDALAELLGQKLEEFFNLQDIIRRVVATVDNLPRENISPRLMPVKPVTGRLVTTGKGESLALSPENAARYGPYVRLAEAVPTGPLVAVYVHFYPLFQQQYEELGYPDKYFNDRLVQVIDHLLAAPEVQTPVLLTQPKVMYQFADPKLEGLSVGQKILVRMGGENAAKVKAKLREIRGALVQEVPKQ
jgi:hypothetical protein